MGGNTCLYCNIESSDPDFCDRCGRALYADSPTTSLGSKWSEQSLLCTTVLTRWNLEEELKSVKLDCIEKPWSSKQEGESYRNYYGNNKESLETFLLAQQNIDFYLVDQVIYCIAEIVEQLQRAGYVLGGVDLSDFWLTNDSVETMVYRPLRPLLKHGSVCEEPEILDFYCQEYINKKQLTFASDVYVIGSIFVSLLRGKLNALKTFDEMRYVSHQIIPKVHHFPLELFPWINLSTSIYAEERYVSVEEQMFYYSKYLKNKNYSAIDEIKGVGATDVGNKKRQLEGEEDELNQDRFVYLETEHCVFGVVADGISTAKIGSGSIAAQIVKELAISLWEEKKATLIDKLSIHVFLNQFVQQANECIVAKSNELVEGAEEIRSSSLMGTTLVATICTCEAAYTVSIGDSRIYYWSENNSLKPLHSDQNVRNELLLKDVDWEEIRAVDEQASLTYYLGMANTETKPFTPKPIPVEIRQTDLSSGELLLLCSDGLTDYLYPIGYQNDIWKADTILAETVDTFAATQDWENCVQTLVQLANDNGGGDNITVLIIAFHMKKDVADELLEEEVEYVE